MPELHSTDRTRARRWVGLGLLLASIAQHGVAPAGDAAATPRGAAEAATLAAPAASSGAPVDVPLRAAGLPRATEPAAGVRSGPMAGHDGTETHDAPQGLGRLSGIASRFGLVELPPDSVAATTGYRRPHHALGIHSTAAEQWLREQGVETSQCMLPMVRLHTRLQHSGQPNSALWIYARCAVH